MILLENFKIKKEGINFCIFELIEKDEYKKNTSGTGALALKTGNKVKEWVDIQSYHGKLKQAVSRVTELAIERGFEDITDASDLMLKINDVMGKIESICNLRK